MAITAALVKELREKTGAGMMDCKKALSATDGDMDKAIDFLREKGLASAAKKAGRVAAEGVVTSYIHAGGRIGVLVEVNCETDFVAGTPEFQDFARDIAMQIAAANPTCVRREEVDPAAIEHERQVLREQAINEGKPEKIVERMVEGRLEKYYKEVSPSRRCAGYGKACPRPKNRPAGMCRPPAGRYAGSPGRWRCCPSSRC